MFNAGPAPDCPRLPLDVLLPVAQPDRSRPIAERSARVLGTRVSEVQPVRPPANLLLRGKRQPVASHLSPASMDGDGRRGAGRYALRPLHGDGLGRRAGAGEIDLRDGLSVRRGNSDPCRARAGGIVPVVFSRAGLVPGRAGVGQRGARRGQARREGFHPRGTHLGARRPDFALAADVRAPSLRGFETEYPACVRSGIAMQDNAAYKKRRLPYASVYRGPLLFALPIADRTPNEPAPEAKWQYALDAAPARAPSA